MDLVSETVADTEHFSIQSQGPRRDLLTVLSFGVAEALLYSGHCRPLHGVRLVPVQRDGELKACGCLSTELWQQRRCFRDEQQVDLLWQLNL